MFLDFPGLRHVGAFRADLFLPGVLDGGLLPFGLCLAGIDLQGLVVLTDGLDLLGPEIRREGIAVGLPAIGAGGGTGGVRAAIALGADVRRRSVLAAISASTA